MKRTMYSILAVACFSFTAFAQQPAAQPTKEAAPAAATTGGAEIGKPAPAFTLKDTEGKEHKLADYKGKVVVIEWSNHTCPFCKRHAEQHTATKTLEKFAGKPVVWIGIDSSKFAPEKVKDISEWAKDNKLGYPILIDNGGTIGKAYGAKTTPHMFVIDQKGTLVYAGAIDDNPTGTKENARNYIAEAVDATLTGTAVPTAKTDPYGCSVKY